MDSASHDSSYTNGREGKLRSSVDAKLVLGDQVDLTLQEDSLRIFDGKIKQKKRKCGFGTAVSPERLIPYYDILWAEVIPANVTIRIDYVAHKSKTRVCAESVSLISNAASSDNNVPSLAYIHEWVGTLMDCAYRRAARRRRAFVLVNPNSGPGGAVGRWENEVRSIFESARMTVDVIHTTHGGQATDLMRELDIDRYDIVVPCSGDGMVYEVFNGLSRRPDARRALRKIAVCHIPCGSGNAMACNLYGTHHPSLAAVGIVKGLPTPLDLISITHGGERTISFLSQALGIVAEADLGTEWMRCLGESRFSLGMLYGFIMKKVFPCDIAVKVEIGDKDDVKRHYRDNCGDSSIHLDREDGLGLAGASASASVSDDEDLNLPPLRYGTVQDPLPEGWELIPYDQLVNFYCGNMVHVAPETPFFPAALINDGYMDLVLVSGKLRFLKLVEVFTAVETGKFFDHPLVSYRKVSAYRIMPRDPVGNISIDGESYPFEPFQAEIHPSLGTVLTRRGMFEAPGPGAAPQHKQQHGKKPGGPSDSSASL